MTSKTASQSPATKPANSLQDESTELQTAPKSPSQNANKLATPTKPAFDPALLDEEEVPSQPTSTTTSPASRYTPGGYNALKSFNGQVYSGMAVGGSHTWNYDQGVWKETKTEPDLWKIDFETKKRRAKNAPENSGAMVGTEYHWLVVAHQYVKKVDANTYTTHLVGSKYKLAHKTGNSNYWSIPTVKAQRERELELLDDAKRRVEGLPPVTVSEKVKVEVKEKGQQKLDSLFAKTPEKAGAKRKREDQDNGIGQENVSPFFKKSR